MGLDSTFDSSDAGNDSDSHSRRLSKFIDALHSAVRDAPLQNFLTQMEKTRKDKYPLEGYFGFIILPKYFGDVGKLAIKAFGIENIEYNIELGGVFIKNDYFDEVKAGIEKYREDHDLVPGETKKPSDAGEPAKKKPKQKK